MKVVRRNEIGRCHILPKCVIYAFGNEIVQLSRYYRNSTVLCVSLEGLGF